MFLYPDLNLYFNIFTELNQKKKIQIFLKLEVTLLLH